MKFRVPVLLFGAVCAGFFSVGAISNAAPKTRKPGSVSRQLTREAADQRAEKAAQALSALTAGDYERMSESKASRLLVFATIADYHLGKRPQPPGPLLKSDEIYKSFRGAVRRIVAIRNNEQVFGTAFRTAALGWITSTHIVAGADQIDIIDGEEKHPITSVTWANKDSDVAILNGFPFRPEQLVRLSEVEPEVGSEIFVIGNPLGLDQSITNGIVSAYRDHTGFCYRAQITAPVSSGSSGSPVFDKYGNVFGVVSSQYREGQNLNFCSIVSGFKLAYGNGHRVLKIDEWAGYSRDWPK